MRVEFDCYQSTIDAIEPGVFFSASIGGKVTFCFSVQHEQDTGLPSLLTLWPGHPALKNKVGVLRGSVITEQPILVYDSARIVPSPNPQHLDLEAYRGAPVGSLMLVGQEFFIQAETGQGKAAFSCSDGSRKKISSGLDHWIVFTSWEIMISGPGGEPHTLCVLDSGEVQDVFR
ncbi:hypothetical protein G6M16_003170 [Agrobacterium tumefaciens]|uniref:hypothetical protein n=1 Tax=unclassified Agrobacterium TaxID=2632611 RepID=UPI00157289EF|nr:hypothetical protein [Agrobacterium tumefaciens]WCA59541.1 hypothetical protein G6M16_003170 [Agrobacterium tumefaciens]